MWELRQRFSCHPWTDEQKLYMGTLAKIFLPSLDWQTKALCGNFGKEFPAILGLTNKSSTWELWQRFSCHPWTDERKLYMGTLAKIFLPSLDWRTKALCGNFGKDFPAILGLTNKSSMWELWQRFSCHPEPVEQKLYVETLAKIFLPSLDWRMAKIFLPSLDCRTKALCGNIGKDFPAIIGLMNGKDFPAILGLTNKKLYVETLAKIFLPSLDCRMAKIFLPSLDCQTKALGGNIGKDFPAILGLMNKSSTWEHWKRFFCHPWTDKQKLYVGTLAKIFLSSLDWRTKALRGNFGKDFTAILGLTNKSSTWELWQRFSCHPWTDERKLYVGTLAKIFLPSLDWRTKALCGNFGKDFPAILGLTNESSLWELWQRFSCHPWTDKRKLYVGTLAKIFLPSLDWRTKALRGNIGKDFPAILGLTNKSSTWELWQRFSCHPWTDERKLYVGTLAKIFLPSLNWWTKALRGNFGKDFPAILWLTNESSTWELWQRFSCHLWTDEQKLYMGTLAKIFLPSLDCQTKALRGNIGKDFPAILGLTNESSTWELWQRFSCHPWTDERKLYVGTLAKIFLPSLDWRMKDLCGNFGKDFPAILGLTNKSSMWELWQRFSCHPWTDEQKLYVGTLAKIFLPSLDWRMAKIFLPSLDCRTKALCGNIGKDFPAIIGLMNGKDFPAILGLTNKKLYVETLAKIFLPSLDCRMAKIFLPSLDWSNKSSMWEHWQRFSCHPWTDEQKLYVGTLAKIFLPSLDWRTKALRGNFGKDFPAILGLTNESSTWELWQRFSCHPWTDERKLYVGTLAKIFLPSFDWRTKALRGNFGKDFPAILGLTNKSSTLEVWQRFSCHP